MKLKCCLKIKKIFFLFNSRKIMFLNIFFEKKKKSCSTLCGRMEKFAVSRKTESQSETNRRSFFKQKKVRAK